MLCPVRICKHEGKQKYLYKMRRRAGSAPAPSPAPLPEPWGGGGLAGCALPGILSREGGIFGLRVRRVSFACGYGNSIRQDILAGQYGGSNGLIYSKDLRARKHVVEQTEIERNEMYYGGSVDCDIIM